MLVRAKVGVFVGSGVLVAVGLGVLVGSDVGALVGEGMLVEVGVGVDVPGPNGISAMVTFFQSYSSVGQPGQETVNLSAPYGKCTQGLSIIGCVKSSLVSSRPPMVRPFRIS